MSDHSSLPSITWFADSQNHGDPRCLCSVCGHPITAEDSPPVRVWKGEGLLTVEARFHRDCAHAVDLWGRLAEVQGMDVM